MALIVGIDPSAAKIAVVALETVTTTMHVETVKLYPKGTTKQSPASLHNALVFMRDFVHGVQNMAPSGQRFAYVEAPVLGRGGAGATIKQAYVGGIIRACLVEAGFTVYDAPLTSWRSGFLGVRAGKGRTTAIVKAESGRAIQALNPKMHGLVSHDGDLTDAAGICLFGADQVRKGTQIASARPDDSSVQDGGPGVVLRTTRLRPRVRRP